MKKIALAGLIAVAVSLVVAAPSEADRRGHSHHRGFHHHHHYGHGRVFIGFGPYWGPSPYWYYPPPAVVYAPPPPPVVVQEAPPVYLQQHVTPAPALATDQFWYYCESSRGYYPAVSSCPESWVRVAPRSQ